MTTTTSIAGRVKELPRHASDVWECGTFRAPVWAAKPDGRPYRPAIVLWISRETGRPFSSPVVPADHAIDPAVLASFGEMAMDRELRYLPTRVVAREREIVAALRAPLGELGIPVLEEPAVPLIDDYAGKATRAMAGIASTSSYLDGEGVSLERVRAFADAVVAFGKAHPWEALTEFDLCHVVSEVPEAGLRYFRIGESSVSFFASPEHERVFTMTRDPEAALRDHPFWTLSLRDITQVPFPDAELWLEKELPLLGPDRYPIVMRFERGQKFRRPNAAELGFLESLLRAVATSQPNELDSGAWSRTVGTVDGEKTVRLELPAMLKPMEPPESRTMMKAFARDQRGVELFLRDLAATLAEEERGDAERLFTVALSEPERHVPRRPATNDRERAVDVVEDALGFANRRRFALAREALRIDPDCVDAFLILGERIGDAERRFELYQDAVNAGTRALGHAFLEEHAGHLWDELDARPYLRARMELARALEALDRSAGARAHWREILRFDPPDHLSARFDLMVSLIDDKLDDEAEALEVPQQHASTTLVSYARALAGFRRRGESDDTQERLAHAVRRNAHVMKYLLGRKTVAPSYELGRLKPGSEDEGIVTAAVLHTAWTTTPGALEWLEAFRRQRKKKAESASRSKRGRKRR